MEDAVKVEISGAVATITLNRPKVLNALDDTMVDGLAKALETIEGAPGLRVVVLTGAGDHFMAGGDLRSFEKTLTLPPNEKRASFERLIHRIHPVILALRRLPVPVVAKVQGAVAGFGMSLLMAADLAVAADESYFTLAYCLIGTSPDGGSTYFLPRIVGSKKAMEIALLGDRFDAPTALSLGLVNWVVPLAELGARTDALVQRLASGPAQAYATTKRLLTQSTGNSLATQLQGEAEGFAGCAATSDFAEGVTAFLNRRKPQFGEG